MLTVLDAALLAPVGGRIPAEAALADVAGEPALVLVDGEADPSHGAFLATLPFVTLCPPESPLAPWCDGVVEDVEPWSLGFGAAPLACAAAAMLLRAVPSDVWGGLVAESTTYSLLQSGPEFARWRGSRTPRATSGDDGPRVRVDGNEILLTRPARHNALDRRMRNEWCEALDSVDGPVTIRGDGPSFCSGGDLDEFGTAPGPVESHLVRMARQVGWRIARRAAEVTVHLHGACIGAGIEIPAFAGRVIAAPDTRVRLPEAGLGLIPGAGGTVSLPRRIGRQRTLDLLVTGRTLDAATALEWGLVDEVAG